MYKILDGNEAASSVAYLFSEICPIYPITPSSPMASNVDLLNTKDKRNLFNNRVEVIEMQSEAGAAGVMHGSLITGSLSSTFTSSQGLLLMIPNMYKIAGEMLPGVIHVASRTIATHALSIFGDHSDIYATRSTGFCMMSSTNVKDAYYLGAISHLSSIKGSLPFLHFFDGFRTSHEINKIDLIDELELLKLVPHDSIDLFRKRSLISNELKQKGMAENEDIYFQSVEARNIDYNNIPDIVNEYMKEINEIANTNYKPFNYYGVEDAKDIIIAMGSVCDTIKLVVDKINSNGGNVGLIEVHLYRPFSSKYLLEVLPENVKNIAVLDRTKESGSIGEPLYLDILSSLKDKDINIVGGRYGLSSKDTTPSDIKSVFTMLETNLKNNFTIGIEDDVTNLSLSKENFSLDINCTEILIYGFGSDGMVSASKDILDVVGKSNIFVQGYFEYDSKKSGSVTKNHLRFSKSEINAPYYITNPSMIVVSKSEYLFKYNIIDDIKDNGILLINTDKKSNELNEWLPDNVKKIIVEKNVKLFIINASEIAKNNKLGNKISKIMEAIILKILNVSNYEELVCNSVKEEYKTKGNDVVESNVNSIKDSINKLEEVKSEFTYNEIEERSKTIFDKINDREGNSLKVSDLVPFKTGSFPCSLSALEKRNISSRVPKWIKENCIECNQCSLVCPHGVIRPKLIDGEFKIIISERDCTGCGVCIETCPGKMGNKALVLGNYDEELANVNEKLLLIENPKTNNKFTIKNSQFEEPLFEFSGACAGCGETAYIKLLTQVFGHKLIIANATGCSSIYAGSVPSTTYGISWANSLFEDNAEFGLGMLKTIEIMQDKISSIMKKSMNVVSTDIQENYNKWLNNINDYEITKEVFNNLKDKEIPNDLKRIIDYIPSKSVWALGGDGWAYDIGFGGIDHILASNKNINILVLDTEVYSNTGGQSSKASKIGAIAEFADLGKETHKKDLFKIAITYPNVYAATISLGANMQHAINVFKEAEAHNGPSIIIAYSPCVEQGIRKGMSCSVKEEKLAVECGYLQLKRYNPLTKKLYLDSIEPNFDLYEEFLLNEVRYNALKIKDENRAKKLFELNKEKAIEEYNYYKELSNK